MPGIEKYLSRIHKSMSSGEIFFFLLTSLLMVSACGKEDNTPIVDDDDNSATQTSYMYLQENGLKMVSVSVLEDKYVYSLSVFKGGDNAGFEADANIRIWSEKELAAYNQSRGTSYASLPSGLYTINPESFSFTKEESSHKIDIELSPLKLIKLIEENNLEYVIPLRLESTDMEVSEKRQDLLLYISLDVPRVEFSTYNVNVVLSEATVDVQLDTKYNFKENGKLAPSAWDFNCMFTIPDNAQQLVDAFNASNESQYELMPESACNLSEVSLQYGVGDDSSSATLTIDRSKLGLKYYLLPLKIQSDFNKVIGDSRICYVTVIRTYKTWQAFDAFNKYLLDANKFIYKSDTEQKAAVDRWGGAAAIWCQPTYWDMAMNAYKRAKKEGDTTREIEYKELCEKIFSGNKKHYVNFDFDDSNTNTGWFIYDDIQWWTITLARAYELFKVDEYLTLSEAAFSRVWYGSPRVRDTGSYADPSKDLGGGMFWQWQPIEYADPNKADHGKMSCINFPTVVAAMILYNNIPSGRTVDPSPLEFKNSANETVYRPAYHTRDFYLEKGKAIYDWGVKNLFDVNNGRVADSKHGSQNPDWTTHVYNQSTFIGASCLLYKVTNDQTYLSNAIKAADYVVNEMSKEHGLLPFETGAEQGIYTAIFAQYMDLLVNDCGQEKYRSFLEHNIATGWSNRDKVRDLCGGEAWVSVKESSKLESYYASGIPALMLLFSQD